MSSVLRLDNVTLLDSNGKRPHQTLIAAHGRWIYIGPTQTAPPIPGHAPSLPPQSVLLPPLTDTHMHLIGWGMENLLPLLQGESLEEIWDRIREGIQKFPDWPAYVFWGVDESELREKRLPTREELDHLLKDRPLVVRRVCGHMAVLNSKALEIVLKAPDSEPWVERETGKVYEHWALRIRDLFPPTPQQLDEALLLAQDHALKQGVLVVHEFGDLRAFQTLLRAWKDGALQIFVRFYLYDQDRHVLQNLPLPQRFGPSSLRLMGIKLFLDGSVGARTAAFQEPYADEPSTRGKLLYTNRQLLQRLQWAERRGLQVAMHAIGDRAIHQAIQVLHRHLQGRGNTLGHRLEHVEFPTTEALQALADMRIPISVQPNFKGRWGRPGGLYEQRLGIGRGSQNNPLERLSRMQIPHAYGTDGMPFDLRYALRVAMQEVPFQEALFRVTDGAWMLTGEEASWGFRVGARAYAQVIQPQEEAAFPMPIAWIFPDGLIPLQGKGFLQSPSLHGPIGF